MVIKKVLDKIIEDISLGEKELGILKDKTNEIVWKLENSLKKQGSVFVGGSLAKKTLIEKQNPDVDIFVRFNNSEDIEKLGKIVGKGGVKIHGSRDYYRLKKGKIVFEIVPVLKISKPEDAENITDLSYFHVSYVVNKIKQNPRLSDEIKLAKTFCHAQNCYGAEGYIRGFSGYALELLIIYYGSFEKFIKAMIKSKDKIVVDPSKFYKNKKEVLENMNEAKLESPIVFVDPTFKNRNALAALSLETFENFKKVCKSFLKKPSLKFFEKKEVDVSGMEKYAKSKKLEFLKLKINTNKQEGDIAGTKLFKFYRFLINKIERYFDVIKKEFVYKNNKDADVYLVLKSKKEILVEGPPVNLEIRVKDFKKKWKKVFVKKGKVCAKEKVGFSGRKFIFELGKKYKDVVEGMGIIQLEV